MLFRNINVNTNTLLSHYLSQQGASVRFRYIWVFDISEGTFQCISHRGLHVGKQLWEPSSSQTHTQMDTHPCIHRGMKSVIHNNSAPPVRTLLPLGCEVEGRKKGQGLNTSSDRNNILTNTYPLPFTHIDTHTLSVLFDCPCWIERLKKSNNNKT